MVNIAYIDVVNIFTTAESQSDYIIGLHKLVYPNWDEIVQFHGYTKVNERTWKTICNMAMEWDRKHVHSLSGGAWLNYGFSASNAEHLPDWTAEPCAYTVRHTEAVCV